MKERKRNPYEKYLLADLIFIMLVFVFAIQHAFTYQGPPTNMIWGGLYILGILPVLIADFHEDLETYLRWQLENSGKVVTS